MQFLTALAIAWGAFMIARELPWWPIDERLSPSPWLVFQVDLARALFAVLPGAVLWGASFPLALAAASEGVSVDSGRTVGRVYAANTLGAIVGSLITGLVLIPWIGTKGAQQVFIVVSVVSGAVALLPLLPVIRRPARLGAGAAAAALFARDWRIVFRLCRFRRCLRDSLRGAAHCRGRGQPNTLYWGEGMNASIAVTEEESGFRNFHVSGKVEASTEPQDMRLQRLLGHLSALMHDNPKNVLVVGFGAGVTAGAISIHPTVEHMVICELEPLIPKVVSKYFSSDNYGVAESRKVSDRVRRRATLCAHHSREIRRDYIRPDPSLGQGGCDAVYKGIFRARESAPQSRRSRHSMGAAVRKHAGCRAQRTGHLLLRLSERHGLAQRQQGR